MGLSRGDSSRVGRMGSARVGVANRPSSISLGNGMTLVTRSTSGGLAGGSGVALTGSSCVELLGGMLTGISTITLTEGDLIGLVSFAETGEAAEVSAASMDGASTNVLITV